MFRFVQKVSTAVYDMTRQNLMRPAVAAAVSRRGTHGGAKESAEAFEARYENYLNRQDIDGWEVRKAMNDLQGEDMVPEPHLIVAAMKACRRINDYALAVRYLEAVKEKCGVRVNELWPYIVKEIKPALDELGILTPEEMNYDKPELALEDVFDM